MAIAGSIIEWSESGCRPPAASVRTPVRILIDRVYYVSNSIYPALGQNGFNEEIRHVVGWLG